MKPQTLFPEDKYAAVVTDLYELTMAAAYFETGQDYRATFELWTRNLPQKRSCLVCCGLADAVDYLSGMHFTPDAIDYIRRQESFRHVGDGFFDYLAKFRFTGDAWAIPEGRVVFAGEPFIRISGPIIEAQIVETFLLSIFNYQTNIATKASRVAAAAGYGGVNRPVVDFGLRRAHGPGAGIHAARAGFIGGCAGTSNVYAGYRYDIPTYGTAAHSWTMAFDTEMESFREYHRIFPKSTILLIDTYDVKQGAVNAAKIGGDLRGVRLDSGDIVAQSKMVRKILDEAGLKDAKIVASGDLNEYKISEMLRAGAPLDIFGVGTDLVTSRDEPALQCVYKLVEEEKNGKVIYKIKLSENKATCPAAKQVFRFSDADGNFTHDIIAKADEEAPDGSEPLLAPVMRGGKLISPLPSLRESQELARKDLARLPGKYKDFIKAAKYPITYSDTLKMLLDKAKRELA